MSKAVQLNEKTDVVVERAARSRQLVDELTYAAKRLGVEEHCCDEEMFDLLRVENAEKAIVDYIAALNEEIEELGEVAKGCAKREVSAHEALRKTASIAPQAEAEGLRAAAIELALAAGKLNVALDGQEKYRRLRLAVNASMEKVTAFSRQEQN